VTGTGPAGPVLIGVGVGPGDPELVTVKAVRVLSQADLVLVPVLAGAGVADAGLAGAGVADAGLAGVGLAAA